MRTAQSGLTLIEAIAASGILAAAVVAGLELFSLQQSVHADGVAWSRATLFANRELERIRSEEFESLETSPWEAVEEDPSFESSNVVSSVDSRLKQVEVRVRWQTQRGTRQATSSVTFVFDR